MILGQAFVPSNFERGKSPQVVIRAHTSSEAERQAEQLGASSYNWAGEHYRKIGNEWICMN